MVECPYCGKENEVNHDEGFGYEEDVKHEMECNFCEKNFVFRTSIVYYYNSDKADCLNDGEHKYELTHTAPKEFSKMSCTMCYKERELTEQERVSYGIGTKEEYFNSLKK